MIVDIIRKYLLKYRNGISLERLSEILAAKNIPESATDIIHKSEIFKLYNGIVFLKSTIIKCKKDFVKEFKDYLEGKVNDKNLQVNITNYFMYSIPDILFIKWLDIPLERKLFIFELLFIMILKPKIFNERIKAYFNNLIELYAVIVIYSLIIFKNIDVDYTDHYIKINQKISELDDILKTQLFDLLTIPDQYINYTEYLEEAFNFVKTKLHKLIKKSFYPVLHYSPHLLKRIILVEFKDFDFLLLLSRFDYDSFYDWISILTDKDQHHYHDLFKDLAL